MSFCVKTLPLHDDANGISPVLETLGLLGPSLAGRGLQAGPKRSSE
jgi:hypothetical protein